MHRERDDDPLLFSAFLTSLTHLPAQTQTHKPRRVNKNSYLDMMNCLAILFYSPCTWWYHGRFYVSLVIRSDCFYAVEVREFGVLLLVGTVVVYDFFALRNRIVFNCFLVWLVFRIIIPAVLHFNKLEEQADRKSVV